MQSIISGYFGITVIFILHSYLFDKIDGVHFPNLFLPKSRSKIRLYDMFIYARE